MYRTFLMVCILLMVVSTAGGQLVTGGSSSAPLSCNGTNCTMASGQILAPNGSASLPSYSFTSESNTGMFHTLGSTLQFTVAGSTVMFITGTDIALGASGDVRFLRDAANVFGLKNGASAQTERIYGTTTGPFYASLSSDGFGGVILGDQVSNYLRVGGPAPTAGTCGTGPSIISGSTDTDGGINVGSGVTTSCTINFSHTLSRAPFCQPSDNSTAVTSDISAVSTTSFTVSTSASIGSGIIYWHCGGAV